MSSLHHQNTLLTTTTGRGSGDKGTGGSVPSTVNLTSTETVTLCRREDQPLAHVTWWLPRDRLILAPENREDPPGPNYRTLRQHFRVGRIPVQTFWHVAKNVGAGEGDSGTLPRIAGRGENNELHHNYVITNYSRYY